MLNGTTASQHLLLASGDEDDLLVQRSTHNEYGNASIPGGNLIKCSLVLDLEARKKTKIAYIQLGDYVTSSQKRPKSLGVTLRNT